MTTALVMTAAASVASGATAGMRGRWGRPGRRAGPGQLVPQDILARLVLLALQVGLATQDHLEQVRKALLATLALRDRKVARA